MPGKVEVRNHLLDVTHHDFGGRALEPGKHVADFGRHYVLDGGVCEGVLQGFGEVFDNDDCFGAAVGELMAQFMGRIERVDVDGDHAGAQDAQQTDDVLLKVGHHDGDSVSRLHVGQRLKIARKILGEVADLFVGERFVHADKSGFVTVLAGNRVEESRNRGEMIGVDFGGNAFGVVLQPGKLGFGHCDAILSSRCVGRIEADAGKTI